MASDAPTVLIRQSALMREIDGFSGFNGFNGFTGIRDEWRFIMPGTMHATIH